MLEWAEKETELLQDGSQTKREEDIYHHGPRPISIICHHPNPPCFSLVIQLQWNYLPSPGGSKEALVVLSSSSFFSWGETAGRISVQVWWNLFRDTVSNELTPKNKYCFYCLSRNDKLELKFDELCQYIFWFIVIYCLFTVISKIPTNVFHPC